MAETLAAPEKFGPEQMTLSAELLRALTIGDAARFEELLSGESRPQPDGHFTINVNRASPGAVASSPQIGRRCLLGVTSNGNTALHLVASRGHAELAALVCEKAPSLVATRNRCLDTPLHCAARGGHREVVACLLSTMRACGGQDLAALRATNRLGDTALHEAVRHRRDGVVDLFMAEHPELASVISDDGISPLYLAATTKSVQMVRLLLRPSPDGTPSPASSAGRKGRTALHVAATVSKEMVQEILAWEPDGPALLTKVDSSGKSPLQFAARRNKLDVVELFLHVDSHVARISDDKGLFSLHTAVMGSTGLIDELIERCPDYYELVNDDGMNLLHVAVVSERDMVVRYICQNDRFAMLLNATDLDGNTPLHLAAKFGYTQIVSILLQTTGVEINICNKDGLTAGDLAYIAMPGGRMLHIMEPAVLVFFCLQWAGADGSIDIMDTNDKDKESATDESKDATDELKEEDYTKGTIVSGLIATIAFAAAFTVPGGFIADDHPHPGTAILGRRFAFRAFVVSDTLAFICSITATGFLIYAGVIESPRNHRMFYNFLASMLVPTGALFLTAAFAFGFHLVMGATNHGLIIFLYMVCSASVLFGVPDIWAPFYSYHGFGIAIWQRAGWRGLLNINERPSGSLELLYCLSRSPLVLVTGASYPLLICATFFVAIAIALEIVLPNY